MSDIKLDPSDSISSASASSLSPASLPLHPSSLKSPFSSSPFSSSSSFSHPDPNANAMELEKAARELEKQEQEAGGQLYLFGSGMFGMMADAAASIAHPPTDANAALPDSSSSSSSPLAAPLPLDSNILTPIPVFSVSSIPLSSVCLGPVHAIACSSSGSAYEWGEVFLPSHSTKTYRSPHRSSELENHLVKVLATAYSHSATVNERGDLLMFGNNEFGQLGINLQTTKNADLDFNPHPIPNLVKQLLRSDVQVIRVACGEEHTLVLSQTGDVYSCGNASRGATGLLAGRPHDKDRTRVAAFHLISQLQPIAINDIAVGTYHSLALTATGTVYSFGAAKAGQLGVKTTQGSIPSPVLVDALANKFISRIAAGGNSSGFITNTGVVYMTGANEKGQLGLGSKNDSYFLPTRIESLQDHVVVRLAIGTTHTLFVTQQNRIFGSGDNADGALGLGNDPAVLIEYSRPVELSGEKMNGDRKLIIDVAAGSDTSALIISRTSHSQPSFPPPVSFTGLTAFDPLHFESLMDQGEKRHNFTPLLQYISQIFSSPTSLNASFIPLAALTDSSRKRSRSRRDSDWTSSGSGSSAGGGGKEGRKRKNGTTVTEFKGGSIDFYAVEAFYKRLLSASITESRLHHTLTSALQRCVTSFVQRMRQPLPPTDPGAYRALLIVLQSPHLSGATLADVQLVCDVAGVIKRAPSKIRGVLVQWLAQAPHEILASRFIKMMVRMVENRFQEQARRSGRKIQSVGETEQDIVELLGIIHQATVKANEVSCGTIQNGSPSIATSNASSVANGGQNVDLSSISLCSSRLSPSLFFCHIREYIDLDYECALWISAPSTVSSAQLPPFSLLRSAPFLLDPATKSQVLRFESERLQIAMSVLAAQAPYLHLTVRRSNLVDDTIYQLAAKNPAELRKRIQITFAGEEGLDYGGLAVEFFGLVIKQLMQPQYELFDYNEESRLLWFNRQDKTDPSKLSRYYLTGVLFGLALYNGVAVAVAFPSLFYKMLLIQGHRSNLNDLRVIDPVLANSLQQLLAYQPKREEKGRRTIELLGDSASSSSSSSSFSVASSALASSSSSSSNFGVSLAPIDASSSIPTYNGRPSLYVIPSASSSSSSPSPPPYPTALATEPDELSDTFGLTFQINEEVRSTQRIDGEWKSTITIETVDLIENGESIPVNFLNRHIYVDRYLNHLFHTSIAHQSQSFLAGFRSICSGRSMTLFSPADLELLLTGDVLADYRALQRSCRYEGYTADSQVIKWFWSIVQENLTKDEKAQLLTFFSGSSRIPINGLGELKLVIQRAGPDSSLLPAASTCYQILLLPDYSSREKLETKLKIAIRNSEGFGLQ